MAIWNPWHGCHKISPGCMNCYVYIRDESIGKDASVISKTGSYTPGEDKQITRAVQNDKYRYGEKKEALLCITKKSLE